jgi:hypothetical protein
VDTGFAEKIMLKQLCPDSEATANPGALFIATCSGFRSSRQDAINSSLDCR